MEINKILRPLVSRFIKVDNYDKMKAILDIGISGVEMIDTYYVMNRNIEGDKQFQNEITKLNTQMEKLRIEQEKEREEIHKKNNLKCARMEEYIEKINMEKQQLSHSVQERLNKQQMEYMEKIENLKNELFEYRKHASEESVKKAEEQFNILQESINSFNEKMENYRNDKEKEINTLREVIENQYKDSQEILTRELKKLEIEKEKQIDELMKENKRFKDKYEKLEVNSVLKGRPFEDALEEELNELFEQNNNDFTIKRCADKKGKGDFIITNNYSKFRIMLEAKNMPKVSSSVKDQQPKFYSDVRNKTNNYDGGLLISSGLIESKKNFQFEILDDGKVIFFIENYNLNRPETINMILNVMHGLISHSKTNSSFTKEKILDVQIERYQDAVDNLKYIKQLYDNQNREVVKSKEIIFNWFNLDADEYISQKKTLGTNLNFEIKREIEEFIKKECGENENIKITNLKKNVYEKYEKYIKLYKTDKSNGISKKMIDSIIKKTMT